MSLAFLRLGLLVTGWWLGRKPAPAVESVDIGQEAD
jgi:hypothetical protein